MVYQRGLTEEQIQQQREEARARQARRAISSAPVVQCDAFRRNPDGSWTTVKQTRVFNPAGYEIALTSNMRFPKGKGLIMMGFDLADFLEQHCK